VKFVMDSRLLEVASVREGWLSAIRASDAARLASMVTEDVVVVHGDGRCIRGRDEVRADFVRAFELFRIDQQVTNPEVIRRGDWAFEVAEVETTLTPLHGGEIRHAVTTSMVVLRKQRDSTWKVARVVGLLP
jgi:uncharacterized protein (TIGR02246 family)